MDIRRTDLVNSKRCVKSIRRRIRRPRIDLTDHALVSGLGL